MPRTSKSLKSKKDFAWVFKVGKKQVGRLMVVYAARNGLTDNRYGFVASKKVGNAVVRNRAKRRLRESVRRIEGDLKCGFDVILIARPDMDSADFQSIMSECEQLLKRAGLK